MYNSLRHLNISNINISATSYYSCHGYLVMMTVLVKIIAVYFWSHFKFIWRFIFICCRICMELWVQEVIVNIAVYSFSFLFNHKSKVWLPSAFLHMRAEMHLDSIINLLSHSQSLPAFLPTTNTSSSSRSEHGWSLFSPDCLAFSVCVSPHLCKNPSFDSSDSQVIRHVCNFMPFLIRHQRTSFLSHSICQIFMFCQFAVETEVDLPYPGLGLKKICSVTTDLIKDNWVLWMRDRKQLLYVLIFKCHSSQVKTQHVKKIRIV